MVKEINPHIYKLFENWYGRAKFALESGDYESARPHLSSAVDLYEQIKRTHPDFHALEPLRRFVNFASSLIAGGGRGVPLRAYSQLLDERVELLGEAIFGENPHNTNIGSRRAS